MIDSDKYSPQGPDPAVTFNAANPSAPAAIGLAEISNANFFSENTFGTKPTDPPFPRAGTAGLVEEVAPQGTLTPDGLNVVRRYWRRPAGQGSLPVRRLRADCVSRALNPLGTLVQPSPCVDGAVWDSVAELMLPRAVGYARGVLDYFFRGRLRVVSVFAGRDGVLINIQNTSTDETMEGVFEVYARHQKGTSGERRQRGLH